MKNINEVLTKFIKNKKPISVVYRNHTGQSTDPRTNLVVENFHKQTGFIQFSHYQDPESKKKDATIYTTIDEIARIIDVEN